MTSKRCSLWLRLSYLALLIAFALAEDSTKRPVVTNKKQPNIIFILTDDQDLHMDSLEYMPSLQKHLVGAGSLYKRHYCTISLCCPSRASLWTGKASHNTNVTDLRPPYGGYPKFMSQGYNSAYLPVWLQAAGYSTFYAGKFLNYHTITNYDKPFPASWTGSDFLVEPYTYHYYQPAFQRDRSPPVHHPGEYSTDLVTKKALGFLDDAVEDGGPFFLTAAPIAPHSEVVMYGDFVGGVYTEIGAVTSAPMPAERHKHMFVDAVVPRTPNFNPAKPNGVAWVSTLPLQNQTNVDYNDQWYRNRLQALQSVDDMIDALVARLKHHGILDETYIFYTTDNGYHIGQHRLQPSKQCAYEEDVNIPLVVRGPGVAANQTVEIITSHTDLVPTFLNLAGAPLLADFDGSVIPVQSTDLTQAATNGSMGDTVFLEHWGVYTPEGAFGNISEPNSSYKGVRFIGNGYDLLYTVWCTGDHELYNLQSDPFETSNLYPEYVASLNAGADLNEWPEYTTTVNATATSLKRLVPRLDAATLVLKTCKAESCRNPWLTLHPEGNVDNLNEALNSAYDSFYENQESRVSFKDCIQGYLIENELPINIQPYNMERL